MHEDLQEVKKDGMVFPDTYKKASFWKRIFFDFGNSLIYKAYKAGGKFEHSELIDIR